MSNWGYTKELSNTEYRTEKGKYKKQNVNLKSRGKESGITYELRDAFSALVKQGALKDVKGDGFTKQDALNMYKELDKIQKAKKYDTDYKHMSGGSKFNYSEEDIAKIAKAAGYKTIDKQVLANICRTDHTGVKKEIKMPIESKSFSEMNKWNKKHPMQLIRYDGKEFSIYTFDSKGPHIFRDKSVGSLMIKAGIRQK